jgi:glycosyltransferase involved in cell wall biosynthesis
VALVQAGSSLVTVITPAHNVGLWIGDAVDSVTRQTETRFEYVVVDDGSTDGTAEIVRRKAANDSRIHLISTENAGSGAARNLALKAAETPFVAFLDGDDRWHPMFLQRQLDVLRSAPRQVGATFAHTRVMLESGQVVGVRWQPSGPCDADRMLVENNPAHNGSSLLIRRSCFDEVGLFDTGLASCVDFDMWLRIGTESSTPLFWGVRRYLIDMRLMRTGSISSNRSARFEALDGLLARFAPTMTRLHPGLSYVRPAVFAYRDGFDEVGDRWAAQARRAGTAELARTMWGRTFLTWSNSGPAGRAKLRAVRNSTRAGIYKTASAALRLAH